MGQIDHGAAMAPTGSLARRRRNYGVNSYPSSRCAYYRRVLGRGQPDRFAQLTEVQVLDSLKGYDKVLCVSYHRPVQLADVPGVEHIKELAFPLPADEKRASATHTPEQMKSLETDLRRTKIFFSANTPCSPHRVRQFGRIACPWVTQIRKSP